MARLFTTQFHHHNKMYTAVITQLDDAVKFYVPDESLHHIIHNGRFSYNPQEGLHMDTPNPDPLRNLISDIIMAIELQNQKQNIKTS